MKIMIDNMVSHKYISRRFVNEIIDCIIKFHTQSQRLIRPFQIVQKPIGTAGANDIFLGFIQSHGFMLSLQSIKMDKKGGKIDVFGIFVAHSRLLCFFRSSPCEKIQFSNLIFFFKYGENDLNLRWNFFLR